ncbi:MAG: hypothetical protein IJZ96_05085 [Lachnospiraceae bacterium]|nr:hypothetical protein [Lachnospiraceae bacterium]MBR3833045.1 hypothetical protein [Lachnospiraceae bacterium]
MRQSLADVLAEARKESIRESEKIRACVEAMGEVTLYELLLRSGYSNKDKDELIDNYLFMGVIISYEALKDLSGPEIEKGLRKMKLRDFCCMSDHLDKYIDKELMEGLLSEYQLADIYGIANRNIGHNIQEAGLNGHKAAKDFARINVGSLDTMLNFPEDYNPNHNYGKSRMGDFLLDGGIGGAFRLCKDYDINKAIEGFIKLATE